MLPESRIRQPKRPVDSLEFTTRRVSEGPTGSLQSHTIPRSCFGLGFNQQAESLRFVGQKIKPVRISAFFARIARGVVTNKGGDLPRRFHSH
ncbi:hypothetical protein RISK_004812 [Rhodopirellula islandica]|uniref:Uncharacterized protein n=1 Tax=Rhodopirellula islandica TaxID=595434 RepID=A0A0J1B9G4_RHOIS|nr:hypothetical protein RISK_004812 [Rhodopirellula islandica]